VIKKPSKPTKYPSGLKDSGGGKNSICFDVRGKRGTKVQAGERYKGKGGLGDGWVLLSKERDKIDLDIPHKGGRSETSLRLCQGDP